MDKRTQIAANIERLDGTIKNLTAAGAGPEEIGFYQNLRNELAQVAQQMGFYSERHPLQSPEMIARRDAVSPNWVEGTDGPLPDWKRPDE
jgi:hypothetical protein